MNKTAQINNLDDKMMIKPELAHAPMMRYGYIIIDAKNYIRYG